MRTVKNKIKKTREIEIYLHDLCLNEAVRAMCFTKIIFILKHFLVYESVMTRYLKRTTEWKDKKEKNG